MQDVFNVELFNKKIYINASTGKHSFNFFEVLGDGYININEEISMYSPSCCYICLNLTDSCNLNCKYCFNKKKTGNSLTLNDAIKFIDDMIIFRYSSCEKYFIDLSGKGEPLLKLDTILKIKKHCDELQEIIRKEITIQFVCNGTLLTENTVSLLQENSILFGVSIDGNKQTHDMYRRTVCDEPTYELIIQNIKKIEHKEYLGAAITISDSIFPLWDTILELKKYFPTISIKPVRDANGLFTYEVISKWIIEYKNLTLKLIEEINENNFTTLFALINGDDYFGKFIRKIFLDGVSLTRCDQGISRITLDTTKKIIGCPSLFNYSKESIKGIKEELSEQIYTNIKYCSHCPYILLCGGECLVERIFNKGNNSSMCSLKKALINLALYLKLTVKLNEKNFTIIINKCEEIFNRNFMDKELKHILEENKDKSFMQCKQIYYEKEKNK